jgi:GxxExxY protein
MLPHEELTGKIIGAAIQVHTALGPGFLESIYQRAMEVELHRCDLAFARQLDAPIMYRGCEVGRHRADLVVANTILVELKVVEGFEHIHYVIARSYLRAMNLDHALLLNFYGTTVRIKRVTHRP